MDEYRSTPTTPEEWLKIFHDSEAGWMQFDNRWITPPKLIAELCLGLDAGSTSVEMMAGFIAMRCAYHCIQHRLTVRPQHLGESSWDELEEIYLETMMVYNAPFFSDHLTCGTSMRFPFPMFTKSKPIEFYHDLLDETGEQISIKISNEDEYEVLLNGIVLYFDQWIGAVGQGAFSAMKRRVADRHSLNGLVLPKYREEDRAKALIAIGKTEMDDEGYCV